MFADIHCHPSLYPYNNGHHITYTDPPDIAQRAGMINTLITSDFSQCDCPSLDIGQVRLVFHALYPIERGFLSNIFTTDIFKDPTLNLGEKVMKDLLGQFITPIKLVTNPNKVLARVIFNMKGRRFREITGRTHSYFNDLVQEYAYFLKEADEINRNKSNPWQVEIIRDFAHLRSVLELDANYKPQTKRRVLCVVFTIEGGHALGVGQADTVSTNDELVVNSVDSPAYQALQTRVLNNIATIKQWGPNGVYSPVFITLTHHFWNQLCGHSMSFAAMMHKVFDQREGLEAGMTQLGIAAVKALLSRQNGRRILIDVKHMSITGRRWYYNYLKEVRETTGEIIPIIASHVGVNGLPTINITNISTDHDQMDSSYNNSGWFNNWGINLFDDEIMEIFDSNGLIGLNFDQRILTGYKLLQNLEQKSKNISNPLKPTSMLYKSIWAEPILANFIHVVQTVYASDRPDKSYVWQMMAIGSDFDGLINALDAFCNARDFTTLKEVLLEKFKIRAEVEPCLQGINIAEMLDSFFYKNALRFLERIH
jgi:microsomal dipeptidase-like Zn-dependent dipeptidase